MSINTPAQEATSTAILGVLQGSTTVEQAIANIDAVIDHDPTPKDVQHDVEPNGATVIDMATKATPKRAANRKAKNAENAERLAGAKKVADSLTPVEPAKKKPAKKAAAPKAAPKAAAPTTPGTRVSPVAQGERVLDTKAPKLTWEAKGEDGDTYLAMGHKGGASADAEGNPRYQYRTAEGSAGGWFASQRLAKGGKWTTLGGSGKATTKEQAQRLAEFADAGAHWLAYTVNQALTHDNVIETFSKAAKK